MSDKRSVSVRIRGQNFRIVSSEGEKALQHIAGYVDETMAELEERTGLVDSLDIALLTSLNLAREVMDLRGGDGKGNADPRRLRALIELAESAVASDAD